MPEAKLDEAKGAVSRFRSSASARWAALRQSRPGIDHVVVAWQHYQQRQGDFLAAGLTYFSFLALFPLIFVAVSVAGYVLSFDHSLLTDFQHTIERNVPGQLGENLKGIVNFAVDNKTKVGVIGLVGFAWSGLGWIDNLRTAVDTVWGADKRQGSFVKTKLADALVLGGLGLGVLLSLALTAGGTALSGHVLKWIHLDHAVFAGWLVKLVGLGLAVAGDMLVFGWVLIRLPQVVPSRRTTIRTSLLAASGFEVLKLAGTWYMAKLASSPAAVTLGAAVGVLVFMYLVSRYLLYCAAWAATAEGRGASHPGRHEAPAASSGAPAGGAAKGAADETPTARRP